MNPTPPTLNNKRLIGIIIFLLLLAGVAFFFVVKKSDKAVVTPEAPVLNNTVTGDLESEQGQYEIKVEPLVRTANIAVPDLGRNVGFGAADQNSKIKIEQISNQLKADANKISLWMELALLRKSIGDYEGARQVWEYVVSISPDYIVPLINLGNLYQFNLNNYLKAEEYMKKVIQKDGAAVDSYYRLYLLYALSYKEKIAEAPKVLLQGLSANPKSIDLMIHLAEHYKNTNDKANAIVYYDKAIAALNAIGDVANAAEIKKVRDSLIH